MGLALGLGTPCHRPRTALIADQGGARRGAAPRGLVACAAVAVGLLLLQAGAVLVVDSELALRVLLPTTMAGVLPLAWLGRRLLGVRLLAAGLLLNLAVICANGGLMPIAPQTVQAVAGPEEVATYDIGEWLPGSKNVLLEKEATRLQPLSDAIVLPGEGWTRKAVSPGDLVVAAGVAVLAAQALAGAARAWAGRQALIRVETPVG